MMAKITPPVPPPPGEIIRATLDMIYREQQETRRLVEEVLKKFETGLGRGGMETPDAKP